MKPGLREAWSGRRSVLLTHPKNQEQACVLSRQIEVLEGRTTTLKMEVNNHPKGDWLLAVRIDGEEVIKKTVSRFVFKSRFT